MFRGLREYRGFREFRGVRGYRGFSAPSPSSISEPILSLKINVCRPLFFKATSKRLWGAAHLISGYTSGCNPISPIKIYIKRKSNQTFLGLSLYKAKSSENTFPVQGVELGTFRTFLLTILYHVFLKRQRLWTYFLYLI